MAATATVDIEVRGLDEARDGVSAFKGAVDILGGSVETLVGGLGLLGAEPAWLKNVEDGAVKAIAFADGISRLADGVVEVSQYLGFFNKTVTTNTVVETENTTATAANTTAKATNATTTRSLDTATKAATATTRTFNKVLAAGGIGLLVAGLGAIVANFEEIKAFLGFESPKINEQLKENVRLRERELEIAKIQGDTQTEIFERQGAVLNARREAARDALAVAQALGDEEAITAAQEQIKEINDDIIILNATTAQFIEDTLERSSDLIKEKTLENKQATQQAVIDAGNEFLAFDRNSLERLRGVQELVAYQARLFREQERDANLADLKQQFDDQLITADAYNEAVRNENENFNKDIEEQNRQSALKRIEIEQMVQQRRVQQVASAFDALIQLNDAFTKDDEAEQEEAFERNKKLNTGLALIQTYQAVTAALTAGGNPIKLATGAQFVDAGIALATGLAQVAAIQKQTFQSPNVDDTSGGGGGGGGGGRDGSVFAGLNSEFNNISADILARQTQQLGGTNLVEAYVVAGNVTTAQQADEYLNNRRVL